MLFMIYAHIIVTPTLNDIDLDVSSKVEGLRIFAYKKNLCARGMNIIDSYRPTTSIVYETRLASHDNYEHDADDERQNQTGANHTEPVDQSRHDNSIEFNDNEDGGDSGEDTDQDVRPRRVDGESDSLYWTSLT